MMNLSNRLYLTSKRTFDVVISGSALLLLSPLIALIWSLIKMTTTGPGFFMQKRIGRNGKDFTMVKFRSMTYHQASGKPLVTGKDDERITKVGRVLRRTKLDELPELWNVFIGDMSLVGYRPEVERYVAKYRPEWKRVLNVRPGLTDLLTLEMLDEEALLDGVTDREGVYIEVLLPIKMERILYYIDHSSFWMDIWICLRTVWAITLGRLFGHRIDRWTPIAHERIAEWMEKNRQN
jgi:lipopolysaccharide/colanic/teichoic acid biosynthesis glycosyltransferase